MATEVSICKPCNSAHVSVYQKIGL